MKHIFFSGILVGEIIFALCIAKFFIVFAFDGFYVYSAELFPTVIRYSMARLHFIFKKMHQFANLWPERMRNGIMGFETTCGLCQGLVATTLILFCIHFARCFADLSLTMRLFSVQHVQLILACACVLIIGGICAVTYLVLATKKTVSVLPRPTCIF